MNSNQKKTFQLEMPIGTASNRLRKSVVFMLLKELNKNFCHQCGAEIESEKDLSIEHKEPWLDSESPIKKFFDLDNIAFSHLSCNSGASRQTRSQNHNTGGYNRGCRCDICKKAHNQKMRNYRNAI